MDNNNFETDSLGLGSERWAKLNIDGIVVEVRLVNRSAPHFCAYARLQGSCIMSDFFLAHPTFRKDDWVGVDSAHAFNEGQSMDEKLMSALTQIETVIQKWKTVTQNPY